MSLVKRFLFSVCAVCCLSAQAATPALLSGSADELTSLVWSPAERSTGSPKSGKQNKGISGTFRTTVNTLPSTWYRFSQSNSPTLSDLYLPLTAKFNNQHKPVLALRWTDQPEQHRILFELHPAAVWSDGIPVTTKDIVQTLFHFSAPEHHMYFQQRQIAEHITAITRYNSSLFALHYPKTFSSAPDFIYQFRPIAAHTLANTDIPPAVNGAYIPTELTNDELILERQSPWWADMLPVFSDRFSIRKIQIRQASSATIDEFEQGQVDCIESSSREAKPGEWMRRLYTREQINLAIADNDTMRQTVSLVIPARLDSSDQHAISSYVQKLLSGDDTSLPSGLNIYFTISPTLEWLSKSEARQINNDELHSRLRTGFFEGLIISTAKDKATEIVTKVALSNEPFNIVPLYDIPYHLYACWAWVALPDPDVHQNINLSPLDPVRGGYIGIDRRKRTQVLNNPDRGKHDKPVILYYPNEK
ncbi:MAG: ABC transporter substrate-binding protein [Thalassolituus sp.]